MKNRLRVAKFEFSLFGINTYVCWDDVAKECAVIDPGMINEEEETALAEFIQDRGLKVTHLINTHLHIDHAIGDLFVKERYDVPIEAGVQDEPLGKRIAQQAAMFGMSEKVEEISIDKVLKEGDVVKIGEGELHVLHVPGHSPGSLVYYDRNDGFLFAGDVLFQRSIGRTDLPGGDYRQLINGIHEKLLPLPDDTVVYPGHGPATTIGEEKQHNPYL